MAMDEHADQCRLFGLMDTLAQSRELGYQLNMLISLDDHDRRVRAADGVILLLEKAFKGVEPSKRCSLTAARATATHPCQCQLVWPSLESHDPRPSCDSAQLVLSISEQPNTFEAFSQAVNAHDKLSVHQRKQLLWLLLPLIFNGSTLESKQVVASVSLSTEQVRTDFRHAFHGSALRLLQHFIIRANAFINHDRNIDVVYAKALSILQSSGTGKTKLAVQLSASQLGMLICTRKKTALPTSFPPFDRPVHKFFEDTKNCVWHGKSLPKSSLTVQHKRLAAWIGSYFHVLAYCVSQLKQRSGCFGPDGQCFHHDVERCWQTVVYQLARRMHSGTDFIEDYSFLPDGNQSHLQLCPKSWLQTEVAPRAAPTSAATTSHGAASISLSIDDPFFRTKFLQEVVRLALAQVDLDNTQGSLTEKNMPAGVALRAAQDYIRSRLKELEDMLPDSLGLKKRSFFFLAVDEVSDFKELLPALRRLWRESQPEYTWLIFIDTESSIAHLAGDSVVDGSLRLGDDEGKIIVPPFTYLPLDVHFSHRLEHTDLRQQLYASNLTFRHLFDLLRYFGRPLWGTGLYSRLQDEHGLRVPHFDNILKKLFLKQFDITKLWPSDETTGAFNIVMAAIGQRIPLFFVGHQGARFSSSKGKSKFDSSDIVTEEEKALKKRLAASRAFLQEQVSSYLRIVSEVNGTDSYITATPSEPAVSLAVASEFRGSGSAAVDGCKQRWSDAVNALSTAHRSVGMMLGEEGEECVRLLLTMAADLVAADRVERECANSGQRVSDLTLFQAQCDPICLKDWLKKLFNTTKEDAWYGLQHDNDREAGRRVLEWASDYYLNFTHFIKLGVTIVPDKVNPNLFVEYWCRQAAVYGVVNQHAWDLLIPIYRSTGGAPSLSDAFDPNQLSYVAIQVKNGLKTVRATDRFGPSCWYSNLSHSHSHSPLSSPAEPTAEPTATGAGAGASIQQPWPRLLDDCLEIFFDLRGVSGVCHRAFTGTRPHYKSKKSKATPDTYGEEGMQVDPTASDTIDVVMEEATGAVPAASRVESCDVRKAPGATASGDCDQHQLRPNNCYNMVVGGTSANVLHVMTHLRPDARKALNLLFAFDDDVLQQNWNTVKTECTSARADPITKEFEWVTLALQGVARTHLLPQASSSSLTRNRRAHTSIPGLSGSRGKKHAQPESVNEAERSRFAPYSGHRARGSGRGSGAPRGADRDRD